MAGEWRLDGEEDPNDNQESAAKVARKTVHDRCLREADGNYRGKKVTRQ